MRIPKIRILSGSVIRADTIPSELPGASPDNASNTML
jgi:hypothetical protein